MWLVHVAKVDEQMCFAFISLSEWTIPRHPGISNIAGYCLYINRIARTTFAPSVGPGVLRYTPHLDTSTKKYSSGKYQPLNKNVIVLKMT